MKTKKKQEATVANVELSEVLCGWEGYEIASAGRGGDDQPVIDVELMAKRDTTGVCSGCGGRVTAVHEYNLRRVRDLPILDAVTQLVVERRRLACPDCGPKLERLEWLEPYARVTTRLAESAGKDEDHERQPEVGSGQPEDGNAAPDIIAQGVPRHRSV